MRKAIPLLACLAAPCVAAAGTAWSTALCAGAHVRRARRRGGALLPAG